MNIAFIIAIVAVALPVGTGALWLIYEYLLQRRAERVPIAIIEGGESALLSPGRGIVVFSGKIQAQAGAAVVYKAGHTLPCNNLNPGSYSNITILLLGNNKHISSLSTHYQFGRPIQRGDGETGFKLPRMVQSVTALEQWYDKTLTSTKDNKTVELSSKDRVAMRLTIGGVGAAVDPPNDYGETIGRPILARITGDCLVDIYVPDGWKTPVSVGDTVDLNSFIAYR